MRWTRGSRLLAPTRLSAVQGRPTLPVPLAARHRCIPPARGPMKLLNRDHPPPGPRHDRVLRHRPLHVRPQLPGRQGWPAATTRSGRRSPRSPPIFPRMSAASCFTTMRRISIGCGSEQATRDSGTPPAPPRSVTRCPLCEASCLPHQSFQKPYFSYLFRKASLLPFMISSTAVRTARLSSPPTASSPSLLFCSPRPPFTSSATINSASPFTGMLAL